MTEEEKQKAIDLWEQGLTGREIGELFGVSRCVVLGFINRLRNNGYDFKRPFERNRAIRENVVKAKKIKAIKIAKAPKVVKKPKPVVEIVAEKDMSTDLMGLTAFSCRYPVSPDNVFPVIFCGKPKEHGSYCKEHGSICYYPSRHQQATTTD